ncbi:MAG TPA: UvrB/UvrC motif-containing protein [Candidatus Paceibacterota bacterium]|nr:UvrB/UvrC motif-containing protein [Candidatus Paceibacterota bacterium]
MTLEQYNQLKKEMPDTPGVYYFLGPRKEVLYIGKATSLRDRVRSYFAPDLISTRGPLLVEMLQIAKTVEWKQVDSVLEALILEANLIRSHQPTYNTLLKDDKSFNYVVITDEDFPRVLVVRGKELLAEDERGLREAPQRDGARTERFSSKKIEYSREPAFVARYTFGPFPQGLQLREAMKLIRKIFPYRDTCTPAAEMIAVGKRPKACFNAHIGLCPGVCSGETSKEEYARIVRHIVLLFQGKKKELIKTLEREMKAAAKEERFEEAARMRSQVFALNHIQDISLIKDEYRKPKITLGVTRIEAYDIAHLRGSANVGVMTVVEDGIAQKNDYRKFRIRSAKPGDDVGALREVLTRRLGHDEWPLPRLIAVDGSTAQMNGAQKVLDEFGITIPIVGVVKDEKHRPRDIRGDRDLINGRERDILLANAEAHRFAINYHRRTSRKGFQKVDWSEPTIR